MLISHEYQFIFIKTRKTAGTSIEMSLSRFLGPWDVVTPISRDDELERMRMGIVPRNYLVPKHELNPEETLDLAGVDRVLARVALDRQFYNHCSAREVRDFVGPRIWRTYTKFCFERNPWERVVSEYRFLQRSRPDQYSGVTFEQFVMGGNYSLNAPLYLIDGEPVLDHYLRYENLNEDLQQICERIGIPFDGWMPHAKGGGQSSPSVATILTEEMAAHIARSCQPEIELFGYECPVKTGTP